MERVAKRRVSTWCEVMRTKDGRATSARFWTVESPGEADPTGMVARIFFSGGVTMNAANDLGAPVECSGSWTLGEADGRGKVVTRMVKEAHRGDGYSTTGSGLEEFRAPAESGRERAGSAATSLAPGRAPGAWTVKWAWARSARKWARE